MIHASMEKTTNQKRLLTIHPAAGTSGGRLSPPPTHLRVGVPGGTRGNPGAGPAHRRSGDRSADAGISIYARLNTKVVDRALQAADRLWDGNGSDQAQLENRELAMLTQG